MPRIVSTTNRCNVCRKTHRPGPDEDDSDRLEAGTEDTDLLLFWSEVTIRAKQPNPDFARLERKVKREVSTQWPTAVQQAQQAKGAPLDSEEIEGLKEFLERQARGDEDPAELVIGEAEIILCETCTPLLANLGLVLSELAANGSIPSAWAPAAVPATSPPVAVVSTPAPQPSPPLSVVNPTPEPPTTPSAA